MTRLRERTALRLLGAGALGLLAFWLTFSVYALHPALKFNPLRLPFESSLRMQRWTPEGWKFFTRNPREDRTRLLGRRQDGAWIDIGLGPNFKVSNLLGFSRVPRAQGIELALLVHDVAKSEWVRCTEQPEACLERLDHSVPLSNHSPEPTVCGTVGFVMQQTMPWAWASMTPEPIMPSRVMRLEVQC